MAKKTPAAPAGDPTDAALAEEAVDLTKGAALALARARRLAGQQLSPEPVEPAEPEAPSRLDIVLESVKDQGKFEVFRQSAGGQRAKVGVYPINEYPDKMEAIAAQYKGGTFTIIFKDAHGRIRGQDTQTFDAQAYSTASAAPEPRPDPAASMMERLIERMDARDREFQAEMRVLREQSHAQTLEMMKLMAARPAEGGGTTMAEAIRLVRELTPPPSDPLASLKGTVEMIAMLKDGAGPSEPQSPWVIALEKGLEVLQPLLSVLATKVAQPGPASAGRRAISGPVAAKTPGATTSLPAVGGGDASQARTPVPSPSSAPTALPPSPAPNAAPIEGVVLPNPPDPQMQEYAVKLHQAAIAQVRPSIVATLIVDSVTEDMVDQFEAMLEDPNLVPLLIAYEPKLAAHKVWLDNVMKEVEEKFDETWPNEPEAEPQAAPAAPVSAGEEASAASEPAPAAPAAPAPAPVQAEAAPPPQEAVHA